MRARDWIRSSRALFAEGLAASTELTREATNEVAEVGQQRIPWPSVVRQAPDTFIGQAALSVTSVAN
jgi:hypothetical protein